MKRQYIYMVLVWLSLLFVGTKPVYEVLSWDIQILVF